MTLTTETVRIVVFDNPDYGPSGRMLAAVRDLAAQRSDIEVERVNVWRDPARAVAHGVMTAPTTIIFVGAEERHRIVGLRSTRALTRTIDHTMVDHILVERPVPAPVG